MTGRKSTRSRRSEILAHHRSSQRAAISIPQQLPARRPSGHGYAYSSSAERLDRSEEHTSELQSLMRISYAVFCLKKKKTKSEPNSNSTHTHNPNSNYISPN